MKDKSVRENLIYWFDALHDKEHEHRKKFSIGYKPHEVDDYFRNKIVEIAKEIEKDITPKEVPLKL